MADVMRGAPAGRIAKTTTALIIISTVSKILGLIRESVTAAYFGANYQTDAYRVANEIPSMLTGVIYAAITVTFIPVYSESKNKTGKERQYFVNNLVSTIALISAVIAVSGIIFSSVLVRIAAPGFSGESFELSAKLTALMFPSVIFLALAYFANGFLQANRSFAVPASMGIPLNLIIIFSIIFFYRHGVKALAIGSVIGALSQFAVQVPSMLKAGFRFQPVIDFKEPGLRRVLALSIPVFISTAFNEVSILISRMLASGLSTGSISILDYANKVNGIANGIFFASLAVVFFPELSLAADDGEKFGKTVTSGLKVAMLMSFPIMVGLLVLRYPIIKLLLGRGEFSPSDTYITSMVLGFFLIGIIGSGPREILNRVFYSLKDTRTIMVNGIITICINIALNLILIRFWGICGLALSSSLTSLICSSSLLFRIRKKVRLNYREIGVLSAKAAAAAAVMGVLIFFINTNMIQAFLSDDKTDFVVLSLKLVVAAGIGGVVYTGLLYILKVKELAYIFRLFRFK